MRKIKFRGQSKDNGAWAYGYYFHGSSNDTHWIHLRDENSAVGPCVQVIPETVGQFIDANAKDGQEIYVGDVIRPFYPGFRGLFEVVYEDGSYWGKHKHGENIFITSELEHIEVIGNVHDNPELSQDKP